MHKLSGMRDPMLNLMINDSKTFDDMLDDQPEERKKNISGSGRINESSAHTIIDSEKPMIPLLIVSCIEKKGSTLVTNSASVTVSMSDIR